MLHRLVNFVLAILMLMPAGICTCDGGVVPCSNHPLQAPTPPQTHADAGRAGGSPENSITTRAGLRSQAHHCPTPRPHQPSCGVVAPEFLAGSAVSDPSTTLPVIDFVAVVEWPAPQPSRFDRRTTPVRVPASPIYLTNRVLLI